MFVLCKMDWKGSREISEKVIVVERMIGIWFRVVVMENIVGGRIYRIYWLSI